MRFKQSADEIQHLLGMSSRQDLAKCARHAPLPVEHKSGTLGHPMVEHTECMCQLTMRIGQQWERQSMFFSESAMRFHRIGADTDHGAVQADKLVVQLAEFLALHGTTGGVIPGGKIEHDIS